MKLYGQSSLLRPVFDCLCACTEQLFCPQRRCRTFCLGRVPEYTPVGKKPCALLRPKLAYSMHPRKQQQPHRSACAAYRKRRTKRFAFSSLPLSQYELGWRTKENCCTEKKYDKFTFIRLPCYGRQSGLIRGILLNFVRQACPLFVQNSSA